MEWKELFLVRYRVLYDFWLTVIWEEVPQDLLRQRPDPKVNSIVWNLWHMARVEDAALNRFIADRPQVLDDGGWMEKIAVPLRHNGFEMTLAEVDVLSRQINLDALQGYASAVQQRTLEIVETLQIESLGDTLSQARVEQIIIKEGLAGPRAQGLVENYTGWSKAQFLMNHGLTHSYHHIGEINVISSLLGLPS
jgi:uncharacterized damage-inducible protein DinB